MSDSFVINDGFKNKRTTNSMTIYNNASDGASVSDEIRLHMDEPSMFSLVSKTQKKSSVVITGGFSNSIDLDSLFLRAGKGIGINSYEFVDPNTENIYRFFLDKEIIIIDTSNYMSSPRTYTGILRGYSKNRITLQTAEGPLYLNISKNIAITLKAKNSPDLLSPYLITNIQVNNLNANTIQVNYKTSDIYFKISYQLIYSKGVSNLLFKTTIINNTDSTFTETIITLEEKLKQVVPTLKYKSYANVRSIKNAENEGLVTNYRKQFLITDSVTIEKNSKKNINILNVSNVVSELQYIYAPQEDDKNVKVNLVWSNTKETNKYLGINLLTGDVVVYQDNGKRLEKLGNSKITQENASKKRIRFDLGYASAISAKFNKIGETNDNLKGYKIYDYEIRIQNNSDDELSILVRYQFKQPDWKIIVGSDLEFVPFEPDNKDEQFDKKVGIASAMVDAHKEKIFTFSVRFYN